MESRVRSVRARIIEEPTELLVTCNASRKNLITYTTFTRCCAMGALAKRAFQRNMVAL